MAVPGVRSDEPDFDIRFRQNAQALLGLALAILRDSWIYEKVKGLIHSERGDETLVIEREVIERGRGEIKRVITEKLTSEKKG